MKKLVAVHPTDGVFVGTGLGLAFFSFVEDAGQESVPVFDTVDQAVEMFTSWNPPYDHSVIRYVEVECAGGHQATYDELCAAGLSREAAPLNPARMVMRPQRH